MTDILNIGDEVIWRGAWGGEPDRTAKVIGIEHTGGYKEGSPVESAPWSEMKNREYVVDLENGHWAYAFQIRPIPTNPTNPR